MNYFEGIEKVWKNHIDMGEADAALRYKDNNPEAALNYDYRTGSYYSSTARYLRSIASVLAKTRGRQREVYRSRNMTSAEKRSRLDEMNRLITSEAQKGLTYLENNLP
jgi:vacuolar-type H+-ATPase catalytic subunit A/Vma1